MSIPIIKESTGPILFITLNNPNGGNVINQPFLDELFSILEEANHDANNRIIVLQGKDGVFCKGMDFQALVEKNNDMDSGSYMELLSYIASMPRILITYVDGMALAGGIGFVAASDLCVSSHSSLFGLSEMLWGLLPCCVAPYLIRRVGFQNASRLTLTTNTINAEEAYRIQLVDYLSNDLVNILNHQLKRLRYLNPETILEYKRYYQKLWIINQEMEHLAINTISRLTESERIQTAISNYIQHDIFPWESGDQ